MRLAALLLAVSACDGGEPPEKEDLLALDPAEPSEPAPEPEPEPEPECGAVDLCTRTIDECGYVMTLEQCTSWYDEPANCADMGAYTECNCDCVLEETCADYMSCGEICFQQHC